MLDGAEKDREVAVPIGHSLGDDGTDENARKEYPKTPPISLQEFAHRTTPVARERRQIQTDVTM